MASPLWRPSAPHKALLSNASLHPGKALPGPQTCFPKPSPQVQYSRFSVPQHGPRGSLRVPPLGSTLQVKPGDNPKSEGSPVRRPLCSGHLRLLTLKVGLEVTFAEAAEVAMQRSQVPGSGRG